MSGAKLSGGRTALSELLRALQPYRKKLCAILLLAIIASTLNVIAPAIIKKAVRCYRFGWRGACAD